MLFGVLNSDTQMYFTCIGKNYHNFVEGGLGEGVCVNVGSEVVDGVMLVVATAAAAAAAIAAGDMRPWRLVGTPGNPARPFKAAG